MENDKGSLPYLLLVDDDEDDRMFFKDTLYEINANIKLATAADGLQLISMLTHPEALLPDLIFLDLNMPGKNGFECLEEIRNNENLKHIFIVIYSTSSSQKEMDSAFNKGANLFVRKPSSFAELKIILTKIFTLNREDYFPNPKKEKFILNAKPVQFS